MSAVELVTRMLEIDERLNALKEHREALRAELIALLPDGVHPIGPNTVSIRASRRFDSARAIATLTTLDLERISVSRPDPARARIGLPSDLYSSCCGEVTRTVTIR